LRSKLYDNPEPVYSVSSSGLLCEEYDEAQMPFLQKHWHDLHTAANSDSIFNTFEWTSIWWKHFQNKLPEGTGTLTILAVWKDDLLIGIAPFTLPRRASFRMKRLRPVGDLEDHEGMTDETPILLRQGYERDAIAGFQSYLLDPVASRRWDFTFLRQMDCSTAADELTFSNRSESTVHSSPISVLLPSTWEEFHRGLSRSMKTNINYYPRKLLKHHFSYHFKLAATVEEVTAAIPDLVRLHNLRANSPRGIKHFNHIPTKRHAAFLTESLITLAKNGQAWIGMIEINGVTVASQVFLQSKTTVTFYYSGFDPVYYDYSLLFIIATEAIKHGITSGATRLNFLPDLIRSQQGKHHVPEWKSRWGAQPTGCTWEMALYSPHFRASVIKAIRGAKASLQQLF
jgi:hypothetical protein